MTPATAKLRYGAAVVVEVEGLPPMVFRPMSPTEAMATAAALSGDPENAYETAVSACGSCCLSGEDAYNALVERYPMVAHGVDGLVGHFIRDAAKTFTETTKSATKLWKQADRLMGPAAENLLAFQAYRGGEHTDKQLAGALMVADLIGAVKSLNANFVTLLKGLSKR